MNSYAIYRIAETLRVLLLMVLAILVFNFYPVTAVMIVMIAVLNDGAILSIAYDNVLYKDKPEVWNMRLVLGISIILGVIGVMAEVSVRNYPRPGDCLPRLSMPRKSQAKTRPCGQKSSHLSHLRAV